MKYIWQIALLVTVGFWIALLWPSVWPSYKYLESVTHGFFMPAPKPTPSTVWHPLTCPPQPCWTVEAVGWMVKR